VEIVPVPLGHQVSGIREGRDPFAVGERGVPADVVVVDVGVDDIVHAEAVDSRRVEPVCEIGVQVGEQRNLWPITAVTDPGVNKEGNALAAHHPGLDRATIGVVIGEIERRIQPIHVLVPYVLRCVGEQLVDLLDRADPLDDTANLAVPEDLDIAHGGVTLIQSAWRPTK
jgi:hypothetical protein